MIQIIDKTIADNNKILDLLTLGGYHKTKHCRCDQVVVKDLQI